MARRNRHLVALGENLRMAFANLIANRGRSLLVILGVALGVTTLMAMVSIIQGLKNRLESEIMASESTQIYVTAQDPFSDQRHRRSQSRLVYEDAIAIEESCPSVLYTEVRAGFGTMVQWGSETGSLVQMAGVGLHYQEINNDIVEEGRFFNETEYLARKNVCVISRVLADDLFAGRDPIDQILLVNGDEHLRVVGILHKRESLFGSVGQSYLLMPYSTFVKHWPRIRREMAIVALPDGNDLLESGKEEIEALLRIRHKLGPGEKNDFHISTQDMVVDFTRQVTGPLTLVGVILASIGLMVGGIGVVTIMLVTVRERTTEIGLRMAVGGTRRDIFQLFLVEASTLTGLGGVVGIAAGLLVAQILHLAFHVPASVPTAYIIAAVVVSSGTGLFFGLYPAMQASRLDPIETLRYE